MALTHFAVVERVASSQKKKTDWTKYRKFISVLGEISCFGWKTKIHGQHAELAVLLRNDER